MQDMLTKSDIEKVNRILVGNPLLLRDGVLVPCKENEKREITQKYRASGWQVSDIGTLGLLFKAGGLS